MTFAHRAGFGLAGRSEPNSAAGPDLLLGVSIFDYTGRILFWSDGATEITGYGASVLLGRDISLLSVDAHHDPVDLTQFVTRDGTGLSRIRHADGTVRVVEWRVYPIKMDDGTPVIVGIIIDISAKEHTISNFGMLDAFFKQSHVGLAILDTQLRFVLLNEALAALNHRPLSDHIGRHFREVIDSTEIDAYEEQLQGVMDSGQPLFDMRLPGTPTAARHTGQVWAVSWFRIDDSGGTPMGLAGIIQDVTHAERTMLTDTSSTHWLNVLNHASRRFASSLDLHVTATSLAELATDSFCDIATVDLLESVVSANRIGSNSDDVHVIRMAVAVREPDSPAGVLLKNPQIGEPRSSDKPMDTLSEQRVQLVHSVAELGMVCTDLTQEQLDRLEEIGVNSGIVAPLASRNGILGMAAFLRTGERFTADDVPFVTDLADRAGLAIDNARLYVKERNTAHVLQRSLLPHQVPSFAEVDVDYAYRASETDVGGDWCDVIALPGHRVGLVVGDVMGHGITAAAAMGRYRTAVHALAMVGLTPGPLLTRINDMVLQSGDELLATCLYAIYDAVSGSVVMASAGHPAPLLRRTRVGVEQVRFAAEPPLGVAAGTTYSVTTVRVPPGSTLVLFSDGVIESRGTSITRGLLALKNALRDAGAELDAPALSQRLLRVRPTDSDDDATVLVARCHGLHR